MVESVKRLTQADGRYLFEIRWNPDIDTLVQPMIESHAEVLQADGSVDLWEFRLQFPNRAMLADFRDRCQDNGIQFQLKALYNPTIPEAPVEGGELTSEQFDILATAHENGYFEIPRGIQLGEVADLIGISSNAASQRMRRALDTLVGNAVVEHNN